MAKLGKIGITVGNKTGGSPAATVSQLKSYLKELQNGFDELKRAAEPAANQVSRLSDSMSRINESASNIVKFSEDLSKKLKDIHAQGVGKLNPDSTVFSSFSDLVDIVTNSVDETKLAKFQSVSKSLRAFSSSLTDIVKFSKDANGDVFKQFVNNLNSEDTKNTKNKIFEFINNFMPSDSGELDALNTNIEKMNNIVSSVKKYIFALSGLRSTGTKDVAVPEEWNIARQRFYDFIRGFKLEGDVSTYIKNVTNLTKPIAKYLSEIKTLNRLGEEGKIDTVKWDKTRQAFYDFLTSFGTEGDVPAAIERVGTLTKAVGKYLSEIKALNKLGQEGGIDTAKWDSVRQKFYDFIRGFGLEGDIPASIERLGTLTKAVGRYLSEIKTLTKTGNIDDSVIEKWNNTRLAFYDFIRGFGAEGDIPESLKQIGILTKALGDYLTLLKGMNKYKATPDNWGDARNSFTSFVTDFNNMASSIKHDKLDELLKVVRKYITIMKTLDSYTPNPSSWNIIRDTFIDFITDFNRTSTNVSYDKTDVLIKSVRKYMSIMKTLDSYTPNPSGWNIIRDTFTDFITDFNNVSANISHDKTDELIKYVRKYISIMKTLDSYTPNPSGWNIIRDTFIDFITDFDSLAKNINHAKVDDLVKVVRKYISIMKTLDSYTPNPSAWEIVRDTFTDFITDFDNISSKTSHTNTDELVKSVRKYISIMKTLDSYTPNPSGWNIIRDTFTDFITDFDNISSKTSHTNTDELVKSVRRYVSIMKTLDGYTPDLSAWYIVRDEFTNFISGFVPSDPTISAQLTTGLSMIDQISSVLKKYISMSKAIISFGTVDWASLGNGFKDFISIVASVVSDPRITGISDKSIQHFSKISNSLKGIATLINSVSGKSFSNLRNNLSNAVTEIGAFIDKMASLTSRASFPDFERVANAVGKFDVKLKDVTSTVEHTTRSMTKFHSILRQIYTAFVGGAVIYSIVRSIKSAVKEIFNLEYAMARVNTIARVSSNELKNMTHFVQDVSASYGIASEKVSKALYDINSATIKGVSSLKILEQSAKLAVAGFTDIDKVTNLIARAVNAYEYSVSEAAKISDILFVTVERGINPMEELSEYMGRLFTVSANAGVSLEEVGAGLATLTARGYQTNVASTALNSAILKLSTGTKELNKLFQQYGYASSASALRTVGLTGALQVLYKATNGATEKLHDLGFNYRDIRAATTLASGAIDEYNKTLALMNDETYKAGLTNKAYSEVQDTLIFKINRLKETYTVLIQRVSEYMNKNKTIKDFIDLLTSGIESLTKSLQGFNITLQEQLNIGLVTFIPKVVLAYGVLKAVPKILLAIKTGFIGVNGVTKAWSLSLKGLGSAFTTSLTVINALLSFFKDLSNIIESGTLKSGLKAVFSTAEGALSALAGLAGRFIDFITFTTTNFGEKWSQHFLKPDYKPVGDESTAKGFTEQELLFRDKVSELNGSFIKKGLSEFDYRTENIEAEFNSIMNSIQNYADSLKLDEEFVNKNTEAVRTAYNDKIKETKAVNALTPNMKALSDVFEEVSKKLRENADKQEDSIAKLVSSSMKAQFGFDTIAKETGMSLRQIKNAFSSDTNIADFKKILEITPAMFSESAKIGMSLFKNLPQEERLSRVFDIIERNDKIPEYAIPKFEALRNSKATFNDLANVTDFNKIANYVADALQLSPEVRKAMSELGEGTSAAVKDTLELSKTLTKLGYDVTKIKPQLSASEIVGNVFGLSEITTLKESLRNKLVKPSELESFDDAIIDSILSNVMEAIGANKSVEEINAMIQEAFPDLSSEQLEDISGSIYSIASRLIKISSDFVKQFSELDFSKTMNRLKFGSELSSFKQYQQVGKEMLKNLYDRTIEGIDFRTLLNEFDRNKEQFGFNQARLMFIEKFGKTGEIAWTAFVDAFKDLGDLAQQFINPLNTEFRNLKKRGKDFVKNYRDSLLSPIEQFQKTEALLNRRLANIREQSKNGRLNPESIKNAMDTIDKLYKLNEETMNLKVPASITASEFVRSGSKEAFDLVARNVFKDTYKVNVRQEKLQKTLVNDMKTLVKLATQGSKEVSQSVTYP